MINKRSQQLPNDRKVGSSLVRRLVKAQDDPAKGRIRTWLCDLDDDRLFGLGLTSDDVAALRSSQTPLPEADTMHDLRQINRYTVEFKRFVYDVNLTIVPGIAPAANTTVEADTASSKPAALRRKS